MRMKVMFKIWLPLAIVALALACGSEAPAAPEPVVIEKEVIKEVEVEKVVEVEKEVIKEVEVEKVVEVVKEVEAKMEKEPARSPLIGDIEGITVLTDFVPSTYSEAPELAAMVAAGELPPVEERVGYRAAGDTAHPRDRQVRRSVETGLHRPQRHRQRDPRGEPRQAPVLESRRHRDRSAHGQGSGSQR